MEKVTLHREKEEYKLFDTVMKDIRTNRKKIYLFMAVTTVVALAVLLLVPNTYRATAYIMPDSSSPTNRLAELASSVVPSGLLSSSLMPESNSESAKLKSLFTRNRVIDALLQNSYTDLEKLPNGDLYTLFKIENKQYARDNLLAHLTINENKKSGIISVSAETEDRILSSQLANQAVVELDNFKRELNIKDAKQNKTFYITQLERFKDDLRKVETEQAGFLAKNRNYLTSTDPTLRQKVAGYEKQILFYTKILYGMKQLLVAAETEINRDTPTLKVIESAEIPILKSGPARTKYLLYTIFASFLFAVGIIVTKNAYNWYFPDNSKKELETSVETIKEDLDIVVNRLRFRQNKKVVK